MRVFKFGGASVNSAQAIRNMSEIVRKNTGEEVLIVVVSAMGKTTNMLEKLVPGGNPQEAKETRRKLEDYHKEIVRELIPNDLDIVRKVESIIAELDETIARLSTDEEAYNFNYDQVVSYGEILSTHIIAHFLNHHGIRTLWMDARKMILTDSHHREGHVDQEATEKAVREAVGKGQGYDVLLTQGFIGSDRNDTSTTTLGREGSDYSASLIANCTDAESVTIWKDVPGFLNADPKYFSNTIKIDRIPYNEAIELAYYGASVIHPKTVKPIQNKAIPLYIRSFINPEAEGSSVGNYHRIYPETPLYIFRENQVLISIAPKDYSFIAEEKLQTIFGVLNEMGVRVNMMQNSALSFSICMDDNQRLRERLMEHLKDMFHVRYNSNLQLITIRYYTPSVVEEIVGGKSILLEQRSRNTIQMIVQP